MKKYEEMTKDELLELVSESFSFTLGQQPNFVPRMTREQVEEVAFEISHLESRIIFYPEENRTVTVRLTVEETVYE